MDIEIQGRLAGAQAVNQLCLDTARLLTQVAPFVFVDNIFALKGGTAINLFVRDMPRLPMAAGYTPSASTGYCACHGGTRALRQGQGLDPVPSFIPVGTPEKCCLSLHCVFRTIVTANSV